MDRVLGPVWMGVCILVAVALAVCGGLSLKAIATPANFEQRQAALDRSVREVERLASLPGDGAAYPKGAVCDGFDGEALARLRQDLAAGVASQGLQNLRIAWGAPGDRGSKIAPLPLRIEAEGSYDRVLSLIDHVSRATPRVFVDTADLTAGGAGARLTMSGKVFCWTRG